MFRALFVLYTGILIGKLFTVNPVKDNLNYINPNVQVVLIMGP